MTDRHDVAARRPPAAHGFAGRVTARGPLAFVLGVLVAAPVLLVTLSLAALLVGGGALAALVLPVLLRHARRPSGGAGQDDDVIELEADQFRRVDPRDRNGPRP